VQGGNEKYLQPTARKKVGMERVATTKGPESTTQKESDGTRITSESSGGQEVRDRRGRRVDPPSASEQSRPNET